MFLVLCSLSTSIDGFIIGINWKLKVIKLNILKFIIYFFINFSMLIFCLSLSSFLPLFLFTGYTKAILFSYLGITTLLKKEETSIKVVNKKQEYLAIFSNSIDSIIVSFGFLSSYNMFIISTVFAGMGAIFIFLGYYFTFLLKWQAYNRFIGGALFFVLAIFSLL